MLTIMEKNMMRIMIVENICHLATNGKSHIIRMWIMIINDHKDNDNDDDDHYIRFS